MPLYEANGDKQKPLIVDAMRKYSTATVPAHSTVEKRASYVVINQPGTYAFSYSSGSSAVDNATHNYITASVVPGDADAGTPSVKLDINPIAWRQTDSAGTVGDVTFVYVRVN